MVGAITMAIPIRLTHQHFLTVVMAVLFAVPLLVCQRAIPDNNLGYPVLIKLGDGSSGSGFFLRKGSSEYLVTAAHVLFQSKTPDEMARENADAASRQKAFDPLKLHSGTATLIAYSGNPRDTTANVFTVDLSTLQLSGKVKHHPTRDVAVVKVLSIRDETGQQKDSFQTTLENGVRLARSANSGFITVADSTLKTFSEVLVGNDIIVFGYPSSIGLVNSPQVEYDRPLLRKGIVAGLSPSATSIILDSAVFFGNSGGPVLELDRSPNGSLRASIIGVVVEYIPFQQAASSNTIGISLFTNSGYSVAVPMDFVLELLN